MKAQSRFIRLLTAALITSAAAAATGCAPAGTLSRTSFSPKAKAASLRIDNRNWQDVRVYVVPESGGMPTRVGTVVSMNSRSFPLRGRAAAAVRSDGTVRLLISPIGSRTTFTTHSILVSPGDVLRLTVAAHLNQSMIVAAAPR